MQAIHRPNGNIVRIIHSSSQRTFHLDRGSFPAASPIATAYLGGDRSLSTFLFRIGVAPTVSYPRIDIDCIPRGRNVANQACAGVQFNPDNARGPTDPSIAHRRFHWEALIRLAACAMELTAPLVSE